MPGSIRQPESEIAEIIGNKIISHLYLYGLSISDAVLTGFRVYGQEIFWSINW
jgi:hypothetical protein